jgi:hypothetical protein
MVEGHFLQMGGVRITCKGEQEPLNLQRTLDPKGWARYAQKNPRFPLVLATGRQSDKVVSDIEQELRNLHKRVTVAEITDRSKSDALSKTIVIVQTTWFTAQCIARARQGLAITELEIVTLAYTALNGVMCFFWWDKPLDVQCPVVIDLSAGSTADPTTPDVTDSDSSSETHTLVDSSATKPEGKTESVITRAHSVFSNIYAAFQSGSFSSNWLLSP